MKSVKAFVALSLVGTLFLVVHGQNPQGARGAAPAPPTLGRFRIDQPAKVAGVGTYQIKEKFTVELGAFIVPLTRTLQWIGITDEVR